MITNERQYEQTRKQLDRLASLLASTEAGDAGDEGFRDVQAAALASQMQNLRDEIHEYERLRDGATTVFEADSLAGLADALIKARIARGWTQRHLAQALGVAEQQIQRYESTGYASASLARLCDVVAALGVDVHEVVSLPTPDAA